jgi:flavin-dependent dehydrogenase
MRLDKFRNVDKSLEDLVDIFLEMPAVKKRLQRGGELNDTSIWQLNFGSQDMQRAFDGALLIGDAAGLINPLTGGGIHNGLMSALRATEIIDQAFVKDDFSLAQLGMYDEAVRQDTQANMRKSYFIQRSLLYFPMWVDLLLRFGGSNSSVAKIFIDKL